jgi:oxygen-independent coproporphyrinogen III oxidase
VGVVEMQKAEGRTQKGVGIPRSAYIHVPFCRHRCGYCNFTLVAGRDDLIEPFLSALDKELSWLGEAREVDTLYLGGGTPTYLRGENSERLLATVLRWHPLADGGEFNVEANPADVDAGAIAILAKHGVTRISLGAQSFQAAKLQLLERDHGPDDTVRAVELARSRGLDVSLDLIFGAPGETLSDWRDDLKSALGLSPDHISTYGLTFEKGTMFWNRLQHGELARIDEEVERDMYGAAIDQLSTAGFEHYEVSNFARPRKRCRHNEVYWAGGEYYAAGPGAARHVAGLRETNHRSVTKWLDCVLAGRQAVAERECLPPEEKARELLVFGLRRMEGVDREWFAARSGFRLDDLVESPLREFIAAGLLADNGSRVKLTREGLFVSDSIWPELLRH